MLRQHRHQLSVKYSQTVVFSSTYQQVDETRYVSTALTRKFSQCQRYARDSSACMKAHDVDWYSGCEVVAIFVCPRWPSAAILDFIEPQIAPFDPPTPKTLAQDQTWSGLDAPFARYSHLNYTVTLKLGFGVTQGHRKWHHSIEHIGLYIRLP